MAIHHTHNVKNTKKHSTKKHSTKKHSTKKHSTKQDSTKKDSTKKTESHSGSSAMNYCVGCRGKTMIHNLHEEEYKQHGKMRKRLVGKCDKNHKFFRFIKS